jgi:N-acetylgalactosamine kinase
MCVCLCGDLSNFTGLNVHRCYRVNLVGEHVDYCGYSVLPMAIQYDVIMAVKPISEPELQLTNTDSSHSDFKCDINSFRYVSTRSYK